MLPQQFNGIAHISRDDSFHDQLVFFVTRAGFLPQGLSAQVSIALRRIEELLTVPNKPARPARRD